MKLFYVSIIFFLLICSCSSVQEETTSSPTAFAAIIVEDMDVSKDWYQMTFDMEVISEKNVPERGLLISNLINEHLHLGLINFDELSASNDSVTPHISSSRQPGLFKFGFTHPQFENFIQEKAMREEVVYDSIRTCRTIVTKDPDGNRVQVFEKVTI